VKRNTISLQASGFPRVTRAMSRAYNALLRLGADGWPVSVREVQRELGYTSTAWVHDVLHELRRSGLAVQHPRNPRGGWKAKPPA